jgi:hypothetical protein
MDPYKVLQVDPEAEDEVGHALGAIGIDSSHGGVGGI